MNKAINWHIAGRGAIGLLWAYHWQQQKYPVTLLDHQSQTTTQQAQLTIEKKLERKIEKQTANSEKFSVEISPLHPLQQQSLLKNRPISHLLLPLKAFHIKTVFAQLQPRLTDNAIIVLCHNGMGTIDEITPLLTPKQSLIFATTTHGAYRKSRSHVVHSGLGQTQCGTLVSNHQPHELTSITQGLPPSQWQQNINQVLWTKLAINCVINPLTAINDCNNGALADPKYQPQIQQLCEEFCQVAQAENIEITLNQTIKTVTQVITATAQNYSSMQQDISHQRPSEIDYITGYLLKKAQQHHIATPNHQAIYQQIIDR